MRDHDHLAESASGIAAVWNGSDTAFLFGGKRDNNLFGTIQGYDPPTEWHQQANIATSGLALNPVRRGASAVWSGSAAFVFGGQIGAGGPTAQIMKYTPNPEALEVVDLELPTATWGASAVWTGTVAYIFGGRSAVVTDDIVKFDPSAGTVSVVADLPSARTLTSAVWTGTSAYIFGGSTEVDDADCSSCFDDIVLFTPPNSVSVLTPKLPSKRQATSAVWTGTIAYVLGGIATDGGPGAVLASDDIVKFTPGGPTVAMEHVSLPTPRFEMGAVWDGTTAYLLGGANAAGGYAGDVIDFNPVLPGLISGLTVTREGLFQERARVRWQPPSHFSDDGVDLYSVYRAPEGQEPSFRDHAHHQACPDPPQCTQEFVDSDLDLVTTYCWRAAAKNANGEGPRQALACA